MTPLAEEIVGRERELEAIRSFLVAGDSLPGALVIAGAAGIGKTTLWRTAVAEAGRAGFRVLVCRPAGAEVRLSFAALADLFEDALDGLLPALPTPQRRALEVALLRRDARGNALEERAVFAGILESMRRLAAVEPLAIAIDDAQWLDQPSAAALEFAARRLRSDRVAFLISLRTESTALIPLGLDRALTERRVLWVDLPPLSLGAAHRVLRERTGRSFTRPALRRIHEASGGNPFYALELARADAGLAASVGAHMPLPHSLDELLGQRIGELPAASQTVLFLAAAVPQPTVRLLDDAYGEPTIDLLNPAAAAGVVRLDDGDVRFVHPLLAAAAYGRGARDRRRWHARLAEISDDIEERARHRSVAIAGPDSDIAELLAEAARSALARGAPGAAVELFESAISRTPPGDVLPRVRLIVEAAPWLLQVGERRRARALLEDAIASSVAGPGRADALIQLAELVEDDPGGDVLEREMLAQALHEAGDDPRRQAAVLLQLEMLERSAEHFTEALDAARRALLLAEEADDRMLLTHALTRTADLEILTGVGGEPVQRFARAMALNEVTQIDPSIGPPSMLAVCLMRAGRLDEARPLLVGQHHRAVDEGMESSRDRLCLFLTELEWIAGNWDSALEHAREGMEVAEQAGSQVMLGALAGPLALVEGSRGQLDVGIARAREGWALCERIGEYAYAVYNRQVVGFLELSRGNADVAHQMLGGYSVERGLEGTKRISFIGDEIEALVRIGQLDTAEALINELAKRGELLRRPPLTAMAARCRALLDAAGGATEAAEAHAAEAIEIYGSLGMPFERARSLLVQGELRRRAKQKRAAREALEAAREVFTGLGAPTWAERAQQELERIGGRTASGGLTATERRVAELVVDGLSNKEVAGELFVSVRAVEANLSRIYTKLGVGSRTELARHLRRGEREEPGDAPGSP